MNKLVAGKVRLILNFLTFQAGWFACVLGAAHGKPWLGPLVATPIAAGWLLVAPRPQSLAKLLLICGVVGLFWDSALTAVGLIGYSSGWMTPPLAPLWILALWILLATTLHLSMSWLQDKPLAAVALGAIAAPLSYLAGARLGALKLLHPEPALVAQAVGWALLLPWLLGLARRLNA